MAWKGRKKTKTTLTKSQSRNQTEELLSCRVKRKTYILFNSEVIKNLWLSLSENWVIQFEHPTHTHTHVHTQVVSKSTTRLISCPMRTNFFRCSWCRAPAPALVFSAGPERRFRDNLIKRCGHDNSQHKAEKKQQDFAQVVFLISFTNWILRSVSNLLLTSNQCAYVRHRLPTLASFSLCRWVSLKRLANNWISFLQMLSSTACCL